MIKQLLLNDLSSHFNYDSFEKESAIATREFISSTISFWQRQNVSGHVTVSTWVVAPDFQHILLVHHKKLDKWLQIGGHIEPCDNDIVSAAKRELYEEAGIENFCMFSNGIYDVDAHLIPGNHEEKAHCHYDIRLAAMVSLEEKLSINNEIKEIKWLSINSIDEFCVNKSMIRMAQKMPLLKKEFTHSSCG